MIRLTDICKTYDNGTKALKGVNLRIDDGEFVFLVGASGSGKSTIIKLLTAEIGCTEGRILVNGFNLNDIRPRQIPYLRRTLGVIFQDYRLIDNKTVHENLVFAMRAVGAREREVRKRIPYVLDLVGLPHKADVYPTELSGGEQQRVAIARALVNNPQMIIADEPTGSIDPNRSLEIMMLLEKINELGTTILVVTHAKELVDRFSKRVVTIEGGRIVSDGKGGYSATIVEEDRGIAEEVEPLTSFAPEGISMAEAEESLNALLKKEGFVSVLTPESPKEEKASAAEAVETDELSKESILSAKEPEERSAKPEEAAVPEDFPDLNDPSILDDTLDLSELNLADAEEGESDEEE